MQCFKEEGDSYGEFSLAWYFLKTFTMPGFCCVPGYSKEGPFHPGPFFFKFPSDKKLCQEIKSCMLDMVISQTKKKKRKIKPFVQCPEKAELLLLNLGCCPSGYSALSTVFLSRLER